MTYGKKIFQRAQLLLGSEAMDRMANANVILFGVGGVGSWCAEALVRSGVYKLTIVDFDTVDVTNVNRQLKATSQSVGMVKVDAMKARLLDINPDASVTSLRKVYSAETMNEFNLDDYDYVIDAIDSLKDKALLILNACKSDATLFSSMGAALKMDPTRFRVDEFWKVKGDPLAAALRRKFKHDGTFPKRKFKCVYSDELLKNKVEDDEDSLSFGKGSSAGKAPARMANGSLMHITSVVGCMLAGLVINDINKKINSCK